MRLLSVLDQKFYPEFTKNWDDYLFRKKLLGLIKRNSCILDLGAGAGIVSAMNFRGVAARVCGVDLDPRVASNPYLDEGIVADAGRIPYPDQSFDIVFADNVMEHLDQPEEVFKEIARVLRPGGRLLFKTPNRSHYMPLIARITPHRFHRYINRIRGRNETDTFPTRYRCNSPADIKLIAHKAGFSVTDIELIEGRPEYLRMTVPTYLIGLVYERTVNRFNALARFRILLIAELVKRKTD
jgi:SAM-dependent methyltransferase